MWLSRVLYSSLSWWLTAAYAGSWRVPSLGPHRWHWLSAAAHHFFCKKKELIILTNSKFVLTAWWFLLHDSTNELFKVPVALGLEFIDLLKLNHGVRVNELRKAHESTSNTDHKLIVKHLCVDFSCSKKIESFAKSSNRNSDLHGVDVLRQQLINDISLHCLVEVLVRFPLCSVGVVEDWSLLAERLLEAFNDNFFISQNILQSLQLIFLLLEDGLKLFTLIFNLLNLPLELFVVLLLFLKDLLKFVDDCWFLLDLENINFNFML